MLATFAASGDKPEPPEFIGMLEGASGTPIGETEGSCGGGSTPLDDPAIFCVPLSPVAGAHGVFESGSKPLAVGLPCVAEVGRRELELGGTLGAFAALDAGSLEAVLGLLLGAVGELLGALDA